MSDTALLRLEALRKRNADRDWVNADLYRLLYKSDLYVIAYERIKSKPGNMTAGTNGDTLDGWSLDAIARIIASLKDESFQFKPAKRTYILKATGKLRPLGIPSPRDKVVQEVIRLILESLYDSPYGAYFLPSSHGFRPNRGPHTALRAFRNEWSGVKWIIEGDIKACFDEVDHHILLALLRKKIADGRFLGLIWKALRAGSMWKAIRRDSLIGSSQGSILSPILANIYLHELDVFVEKLREKHEKGKERKPNPEYRRLKRRLEVLRRNYSAESPNEELVGEIRTLKKRLRELPSLDQFDPDFVRIKYIRYADDWIVGVTGPKTLADSVKEEVKTFLWDNLRLQLSEEKTRITHAKSEEAIFLGTRLMVGRSLTQEGKVASIKRKGTTFQKRVTGWLPTMKAPTSELVAELHKKGFCKSDGTPKARTAWIGLDVDQVIHLYNSINRGLLNYYRFVNNFTSLQRLQYILQYSLAKTLARKFQVSMASIFRKHGPNLRFSVSLSKGEKVISFAANHDWTNKPKAFRVSELNLDIMSWHRRLRTRSKLGRPCAICGSEDQVEMHHLRHIRKVGAKKPTGFTAIMSQLNRKQVPVCEGCHQKIHRGEYDGLKLKDLAYLPV